MWEKMISPAPLQMVAFTPKGGCPLKPHDRAGVSQRSAHSSIHPQGWVPIETYNRPVKNPQTPVAFTPKGGCPLKHGVNQRERDMLETVAFTPKGGCPLKQHAYCNFHAAPAKK